MKAVQAIKKNKTIRNVYNRYFAKTYRRLKGLIGNSKKREKEKTEKIVNEFINTITFDHRSSTPKKYEASPQQKREGISFIVLGRKESFSSSFMNSVKGYQAEGIEFIFCVDESIKNHAVNAALEEFREKQSTKVIYFSDSDSTLHRLKVAVQFAQYNRVTLFTMRDITNRNSLISYLKSTVKNSIKPVILHLFDKDSITKNDFLENPSIGALSGCIFETTILSSVLDKISKNYDFFVPYLIFREINDNDVLTINDSRYWTINERAGTTFRELSSLCRDILNLNEFWQDQNADEIKDVMYSFLKFVESYLASIRKNKTYLNCFIATVVIFVSRFSNLLSEKDYGKVLYDYSAIFDFGQLLKGDLLHLTHLQIIEKLIPTRKKTIAVIETEFMQDLKNCFVSTLEEKYNVIYQTKSEFYDYASFHQLIIRTLIQPAQFIVTSNSIHRFFSLGKKTFQLWHGSGMLKKAISYKYETFRNDYIVTSSKSCVLPWAEMFHVDVDRVLPLGHVQTDCVFDEKFEKTSREEIRSKYGIPSDGKLILFAPTFRRNATPGAIPPRYYNLQMDVEKLSEKLAEKGLYLIAKRHHVFLNLLKETGVDWSGIRTSKNRHFLVDDTFTFQELIVSSDVYVTDYSSGIFYAVLRNMPVVLYAPDLDEFRNGAKSGLMVKYPEDMAGVYVGKPDIDRFMEAIEEAETDVHSERYANFKEVHVGACDGHVKERVMKYLSTWDGSQFAKISK